jgi:hypothetical protein
MRALENAPADAPIARPSNRLRNINPISAPPKNARHRSKILKIEGLMNFDFTLVGLDNNDCIFPSQQEISLQFDQL